MFRIGACGNFLLGEGTVMLSNENCYINNP